MAWFSGQVTYSAYPPPAKSAITSSPGFLEFTFLPIFSIIPLHSSPKISLSPHIGAATSEAQDRIGIELADQIINYFNND